MPVDDAAGSGAKYAASGEDGTSRTREGVLSEALGEDGEVPTLAPAHGKLPPLRMAGAECAQALPGECTLSDPQAPSKSDVPERSAPVLPPIGQRRASLQSAVKVVHISQHASRGRVAPVLPVPDRLPPKLQPARATARSRELWGSLSRNTLSHAKTMFDDGRFVDVVRKLNAGASSGGEPAHSCQQASRRLRHARLGVDRPPQDVELLEGFDGGGGVRMYPPHLEVEGRATSSGRLSIGGGSSCSLVSEAATE
jgi:hypothetical protein